MYKKFVFSLILITFFSFQHFSYAQTPTSPPPVPQMTPPAQVPQDIPPIILISGKERESYQKVFIDKVKTGTEINVKILMFDREPKETLKVSSYGVPSSSKLDIKKDEKASNRVEANFSWKPSSTDKGFHTFVLEAVNSKGSISRVSLSYDIN